MPEKIRHRLILHIGLHKTGTTSFQEACFSSRDTLQQNGILYPDLPSLNAGTKQHVLLVPLLRSADGCESFIETLRNLEGLGDSQSILLSAEDLSTFLASPEDAAGAKVFIKCLEQHFEHWQAYAVVREGPEMIKSLLLQKIESVGYASDLRKTAIAVKNYQRSQCLSLRKLLGDRVTAIDYAALPNAMFCSSLLQRLTGAGVILPEVRSNVSSKKPMKWILSADIRRLWNDVLNAQHPYSAIVNQAVERTMDSIEINPVEEERLLETLSARLDKIALEVAGQPNARGCLIDLLTSA